MKYLLVLLASALLTSCAGNDLAKRRSDSANIATNAGWQRLVLESGNFNLVAFSPPSLAKPDIAKPNTLTVYIEGDGLAWLDTSTPSFDPTPLDPVALRLALADPSGHAVYLARPCQFTHSAEQRGCSSQYWTNKRFASEVIAANNAAISELKTMSGAHTVRLVGYSGGAAIALLAATHRDDVEAVITVAGNLDHVQWTQEKRLSPLTGSLNPPEFWQVLENIPQQHYVGVNDKVIGQSVAMSYRSRFSSTRRPQVTTMQGFDHHCCWESVWPELVNSNFGLKLLNVK